MARQQLSSPVESFIAGRAARQQYDYGQTRNRLAELELADAPAQMQQRNALADVQLKSAQINAEQGQYSLDAAKAKDGYARLLQALGSPSPREYVLRHEPDLAAKLSEQGFDLSAGDDAYAKSVLEGFARVYAGKAGIAMTPYQQAQIDIERDKMNQPKTMSPYEQARIDIERQKLNQPDKKSAFRALTPDEVQASGLPAGTSAQVDETTGKIDVLSKRDNTGVLSQKDATTAKQKLTTIRVARKQLEDIQKAFDEGRNVTGPNSFGPGQGMLPTERGKKFDAAVDRMRSTLTALTRVPGVGAMSDYETKLDQGKFPNRNAYESVTVEQIKGIEDLLSTIEAGYTDLLSGGAQQEPTTPQVPAQEITATGPNGKKIVLRNGRWVPL